MIMHRTKANKFMLGSMLFFFSLSPFLLFILHFPQGTANDVQGKNTDPQKTAGPVATGQQCMHSGPVKTLEVHNVGRSRKV